MTKRTQFFGICLSAALALAVVQAHAATTVIDSYETTNYTTVDLNAGDSINLSNSTTCTEGSNSLKIDYNYVAEGAWYKNPSVVKTFDTPVDVRGMEYMSVDVNVPAGNSSLILAVLLTDDLGYVDMAISWSIFASPTSGFTTLTFPFDQFQKNEWKNYGKAANLAKIKKISLNIENGSDLATAGTFTFYVDNMRIGTGNGLLNEIVIEDFESYADSTALNAAWPGTTAGTTSSLVTSNPYAGTKSLRLDVNLAAYWTSYYARHTFATAQDFSGASYFKLSTYGSTVFAAGNTTIILFLVDGSGNRMTGYIWGWPSLEQWAEMYMPFAVAPSYDQTWSCWRQDAWDAGGDCNLANITEMWLAVTAQDTAATYPLNSYVMFDNVIVGTAATTAVSDWTLLQ